MRNPRSCSTSLLRLTLLSALLAANPVRMAMAVEAAPLEATTIRAYDIPAGPLGRSLSRFAAQSNIALSFDPALVEGKSNAALVGEYTAQAAVGRLLAGTGLEIIARSDNTYTLQKSVMSSGSGNEPAPQMLGKISAEAEFADDGSADVGYRSNSVSATGPWQGRELQDLPYSIFVITADLIRNQQATTPDQIFRINPTTQLVRGQQENDQPTVLMRGFSISTAYRDGIPGDNFGHGTSTEDAERIEILTGLSGFLYGPANVGGTVNYVSKRPTESRISSLTVGNNGGSNYYVQGDFGGPIDTGGRFGYRVNALAQDGDTAVDHRNIQKTFYSGVLDWHATDSLLVEILASKREYETNGQAYWALAPGVTRPSASRLDSDESWGQEWSVAHYDTTTYGTQLQWAANDVLSLRGGWHASTTERGLASVENVIQADGSYDQFVYGDSPGSYILERKVEDSAGFVFADVSLTTGALAHKITTGMQHREASQKGSTNSNYFDGIVFTGLPLTSPTYFPAPPRTQIDPGPLDLYRDSTTQNIVLGDDISINQQWSVLAGLSRVTIEDKVGGYRESKITPALSVLYKPFDILTTYASYVESLEKGGMASTEYNGTPVVNAGEVKPPLRSKQVEIGAKASLGGTLLTLALFEIDKGLEFYDLSDVTRPIFVQDGRQVHRGGEFTVIGKATEQLTLVGGLTLLDPEVREQNETPALEGKRPELVSDTLAKLQIEYAVPSLPALALIAGVNYTGSRYVDAFNTEKLSGFTLVDLGARYTTSIVGSTPLTLRLNVNNATDESYWANGSYIGDPRTIAFSANVTF